MPFAHIILPAHSLTVEKRQKMVELVTDAIIAAEDAPQGLRPYITVLVSETADGGWGIGGTGYTTAEIGGLVRDIAQREVAAS